MRFVRNLLGCSVFLTILSCGGLGTPGTAWTLAPKTATTTPNGTVNIIVVVANAGVAFYNYSVEGGNTNGTVAKNFNDPARAQYTASSTPGTYTVNAGFTQINGQVHSDTITITVQ